MKKLTSVTFRLSNPRNEGLRVIELHNGLWKRVLRPFPEDTPHPTVHAADYDIGGKKFNVEVKVTRL